MRGKDRREKEEGERCSEFSIGNKIHTQMRKWHCLVETSMSSLCYLKYQLFLTKIWLSYRYAKCQIPLSSVKTEGQNLSFKIQ